MTFAIGPAGTGKTYLAVATAVRALQDHQVSRLILTRPAVEAGERLGFLPGTLYEKIDPYMRPLYDALFEMTGGESLSRLMERGTVEVAPLAFMRGRTLNDAFIILDEAQNTTPEQMKMFLTRIGFGSKAVVNGDDTQVDLATGQRSGLLVIEEILSGIEGITFCRLGGRDVVRHKIVQEIVEAYDRYGQQRLGMADVMDDDASGRGRPRILISNRQQRPVDEEALARARPRHARGRRDRAGGALGVVRRCRTRSPGSTSGSWTSPVRPTCCRSRSATSTSTRTASGSSATSSWRPPRRRGTTRTTPRRSSGCSSSTGSCICSATTTRTTASARRMWERQERYSGVRAP